MLHWQLKCLSWLVPSGGICHMEPQGHCYKVTLLLAEAEH